MAGPSELHGILRQPKAPSELLERSQRPILEDRGIPMEKEMWIKSTCANCLYGCGIKVKVEDGIATKIEGNPDCPVSMGRLCPKGNAGIMRLYDPKRIKAPLKRTNPRKGFDEDPKWVEISWEEALATVTEKLKKIYEEDPRQLLYAPGDFQKFASWGWHKCFGSWNMFNVSGASCGAAHHILLGIMMGGFAVVNDFKYCNYWIQVGAGDGFDSHNTLTEGARLMADARMRGMKLVTVDPYLSTSAAKSDEWIPIRPGTDRAFIMGMIYVLLFELKTYDREFLKNQTNAPYLIGPDGNYVRDKVSGKALVWDSGTNKAKAHDDQSIKNFALTGSYKIEGVVVKPALQLFIEIAKTHTPEAMSEISSVPVETIRRIAKEYAEAAQIGSKITIDVPISTPGGATGKTAKVELPYRPAAVNFYRGAQTHKDSVLDNLAFIMINLLVGNTNVPGGHIVLGVDWRGCMVSPGEDGMVKPVPHHFGPAKEFKYPPDSVTLEEFMPIGWMSAAVAIETLSHPERYGLEYEPKALVTVHSNTVWANPDTGKVVEILKKLDFIVSIDILENETTCWADIILPDHTYLESYGLVDFNNVFCQGHGLRQPAVKPLYNTREEMDVLTEIAMRVGFLDKWYDLLNLSTALFLKPKYMLQPDRFYTWEEILDRQIRVMYGDDTGLEWLKEKGTTLKPKNIYQPYGSMRIPFYFEYVKRKGAELREKLAPYPVQWDYSSYQPLPFWRPGSLQKEPEEYDMYAITFRSNMMNFGDTYTISWISEVADRNPVYGGMLMNNETAKARGISDGDTVSIESRVGKVTGRVRTIEGVHPEVIAVCTAKTRWRGNPSIEKEGVAFNSLIPIGPEYIDFTSGAYEPVPRVKVKKV